MNGILLINKQKEWTSNDVVQKVRRILNSKVGHTGTLDPMATGVLPLLIGKATGCSKYLINHDKEYEVILQLGIKMDTADSEGEIVEKKDVDVNKIKKENLIKVFNSFIGKQQQIPPIYSAIKVNGKKLYEYARAGKKVEIQPRNINIYEMKLLNVDKENKIIKFIVKCSKGTYIRTLCENIAEKLDTVGYMKELNRIKVGEFKIKDSIFIEEIGEDMKYNNSFISVEDFFKDKEKVLLDSKKIQLLLNGVKLTFDLKDGIYKIYDVEDKFIGIAKCENRLLKRDLIL